MNDHSGYLSYLLPANYIMAAFQVESTLNLNAFLNPHLLLSILPRLHPRAIRVSR